jgi:HD-GYP domain-containing protein (c-di-GMP phosphodiesterase class II)
MSSEQAIQELRRGAGTQFDPAVVDAVVTALTRPEADAVDETPPNRFAHGDPQPAGMPG